MKPALPGHHLGLALHQALAIFEPMNNRIGRQAKRWRRDYSVRRALAEVAADLKLKSDNVRRALEGFEARLRRLGPGDTCFDLGANVGTVTQRMAATGARVHAYEPDPLAFAALVGNVGHLPNVTLHNAAVAAEHGNYRLRRQKDFANDPLLWTTSSYIVPDTSPEFAEGQGIDIEVRAFSDVIRAVGGPVALVKMDIEGSEFAILRQILAAPALFDIAAIFCETHEHAGFGEVAEVDSMRRAALGLDRPAINLYWP